MRERFCLNTATIKNTPLEQQIEIAGKAGFRQIGPWLKDIEAAMAQGESLGDIKAHLDKCGLKVGEVCFLGGWMEADPAQFNEVLKQAHHICQVTRALGGDIVVVVPSLKPGFTEGAPERFRRVCQAAAEHGVRIALESPGIAAEINNLRSSHDLVSAAACPNGGLVIDTFHFFLGGSKVADFARVNPRDIFLVHVSDAMNLPMEQLRKPHDNRTFPGQGILDFKPVFAQLNRLGYNGAISLEIWNSELHKTDPTEMVRKGCESLRRIEDLLQNS